MNTSRADLPLAEVRRRRHRCSTALRWAFTIALLLILATQVDFSVMGELLLKLHWGYIILAVVLIIGDRVLVTLRWWLLLRAKGITIGFWRLTILHLTAGFIGSFLPTSFSVDAVRIVMLTRHAGCGTDCTAASIVDRMFMLVGTMLFAAAAALLLSASPLFAGATWMVPLIASASVLMTGLVFIPSLWRPIAWMMQRALGTRVATHMKRFYWAMHPYSRFYGTIALSSLLTVAALLMRVLIVLVLGLAVGISVGYVQYLLAMPVAWLAAMLPISVGGFGLQEGAYAAALSVIGISMTLAVSISLLDQVLVRFVALAGALVWMVKPDIVNPSTHSANQPAVHLNPNASS